MAEDKLSFLLDQLQSLIKKQESLQSEIEALRKEIVGFYLETGRDVPMAEASAGEETSASSSTTLAESELVPDDMPPRPIRKEEPPLVSPEPLVVHRKSGNLEAFIGENLAGKIGIGITVLGVGIGVQYAIANNLIGPLARILLGYLAGLILLGFAFRLRSKYRDFSAVLLSGAMAIFYFITYVAHGFYEIIPQGIAFALMVGFTVFTVGAALHYRRSIIAHLGLVGAYAIPFLLSSEAADTTFLFSYMSIINLGILGISLRQYWRSLFYSAFGLTWLMYAFWFWLGYQGSQNSGVALAFLGIFFVVFYLTFLGYKLIHQKTFGFDDIFLLLGNAFLFYGFGYSIINGLYGGYSWLGAFTFGNALIHLAVSLLLSRQTLVDQNLGRLIIGLIWIFITLTIPVQLEGNWVTLLWAGEAALLFWIGRSKQASVYELLSYPLMLLAFFSLLGDWAQGYEHFRLGAHFIPLINIRFLSSALFVGAITFIYSIQRHPDYPPTLPGSRIWAPLMAPAIPGMLLAAWYCAFFVEISAYWDQRYDLASANPLPNGALSSVWLSSVGALQHFKNVWLINYSLLFGALLAWVNQEKLQSRQLAQANLLILAFALVAFLISSLFSLSQLHDLYFHPSPDAPIRLSWFALGLRYLSYGFAGVSLYFGFQYLRREFPEKVLFKSFDLLLHLCMLWVGSFELVLWLDLYDSAQATRLGLSILWGAYSLMLIIQGIRAQKKHLRLAAIGLFAVTLVKLLAYDLSNLDTLSKTVVFVSLGALLLVISFLYQKYKELLFGEDNSG